MKPHRYTKKVLYMNVTHSKALLREQKERILDRIDSHHLRPWGGSEGNIFFISDQYPGVWLEHTFDGIVWADYCPEQHEVSRNQVRLFLKWQKPDGQLPCYIWANETGYCQTQECVSFGSLCLDAIRQNPQDTDLLSDCYKACQAWDVWMCRNRMTLGTGLVEMFCGYDTGHDNSGRLNGLKYPGNICADASIPPTDDEALPILAPDLNAVFYGNRMALAEMADRLNLPHEAAAWRAKAQDIRKKLFEICYNEQDQFFYDVDRHGRQRRVKSISITNVFTEGVLDFDLGNQIFERYLHNPNEFWTPYPFPAVSVSDPTWVQNLPGNSWGFYSQGLTALRTLRWMEKYGRAAEMEEVMVRWVDAWSRSRTTRFGQELHPVTGEPSESSEWYSSCMLYFLHAIRRLYGI